MDTHIVDYYTQYEEKSRLADPNSLERIRSQEIIAAHIPRTRQKVLDIGGAVGLYSFWLADLGHDVSLVDLTPKHIEQAQRENATRDTKLKSMTVGNALSLPWPDDSFGVVLLMGPVYHLQESKKRVDAIREALRVLDKNGVLFIACISRFASMVDGFRFDLVNDQEFRRILDVDIQTGNHSNHTTNETYFTDAHLHLPEEIKDEVELAGGVVSKVLGVEGIGSIIPGVEDKMKDDTYKSYLLRKIAETEESPSIIGMSSHFLVIAGKGATF